MPMASQTVEELFDRVEQFAVLLAAAEDRAETDWEIQFTTDIRDQFERYGAHTYLSAAQLESLRKIAHQ